MPSPINLYLEQFRGQEVWFHPNPGNAGDSMINFTSYQLMRNAGINYRIVSGMEDLSGKTVFYGGGGNFVRYYRNAADFVMQWHDKVKHLTLLPATIQGHEGLLSSLGDHITIICRERISFDYASSIARSANILLMDDLAFSLDIISCKEKIRNLYYHDIRQLPHTLLRFIGEKMLSKSPELNSFRMDMEMTEIPIPKDNIDIAKLLECVDMGEESSETVTYTLLRFIDRFGIVNTNRLHICIGGLLLDKKVNFYPNSFYKNKAVYQFSMFNKFQQVKWKGKEHEYI